MPKICVTAHARNDLRGIQSYLLNELFNPLAAHNLAEEIKRAFAALEDSPSAFPSCEDLQLRRKGYRKCSLGAYLFVYRFDESSGQIMVLRFFHRSQNWMQHL